MPAASLPALRKEREERGTHLIGRICEIKNPGHPASYDLVELGTQGQMIVRTQPWHKIAEFCRPIAEKNAFEPFP